MKILLVDDDAALVGLLRLVLEYEGHTVQTAYTGQEALEALEEEQPDLVILDIMMPDINGIEVCARIRATPHLAHLPIAILTAKPGEEDRIRAMEAGADAYWMKPLSPRQLKQRIRDLIYDRVPAL